MLKCFLSGNNVDCALKKQGNHPEQSQYNQNYVALGRCSTSGAHLGDGTGGHCASRQINDRSHGAWCCETDGKKVRDPWTELVLNLSKFFGAGPT